ncbi:cyclodeaminase [Mesorhizobium sp. B4-1-4]|uniref:cyclodeaminase n=1 Tax=Mesorhizobium sp. B4-1-4 TaxID=2589888 RepID=UPI00112B4F5C|nr:cyclodeaminase [Mesorhizobium sp. B4-1-4]UCI31954.1 cyclodeaminase [Mesorhizobium sp. B4-1-4]
MSKIRFLSEHDLKTLVPLDLRAVRCIEEAFHSLATKAVEMPPILRLNVPEYRGEVDVKTAYVPGLDGFAVKISPGFFDNPKLGLPSTNGMMVLFHSKTGRVQALLMDNGYLTNVRTAAAGAVVAKYLARGDASKATIMGAGVQARLQLRALTLVRPIKEARIWARDLTASRMVACQMSEELDIPVAVFDDPAHAVAGAHIIVTTTPSERPIIRGDWLEPGQHVTAMGSDAEHKNELDPAAFKVADLYIADSLKQASRLGELHHAVSAGIVVETEPFSEIGEIIAGEKPGRTNEGQITIADLTGTGIQDTAIAALAFAEAEAADVGISLEN